MKQRKLLDSLSNISILYSIQLWISTAALATDYQFMKNFYFSWQKYSRHTHIHTTKVSQEPLQLCSSWHLLVLWPYHQLDCTRFRQGFTPLVPPRNYNRYLQVAADQKEHFWILVTSLGAKRTVTNWIVPMILFLLGYASSEGYFYSWYWNNWGCFQYLLASTLNFGYAVYGFVTTIYHALSAWPFTSLLALSPCP